MRCTGGAFISTATAPTTASSATTSAPTTFTALASVASVTSVSARCIAVPSRRRIESRRGRLLLLWAGLLSMPLRRFFTRGLRSAAGHRRLLSWLSLGAIR
ncbi:MAG: hypothetical protein ACREV5_16590, partial [Steroidobacter sp.]